MKSILLAVLCLIIAHSAFAFLLEKPLPEMIKNSDLIAIASVAKVSTVPAQGKKPAARVYEVEIVKILKGPTDGPKSVTLSGSTRRRVEDMPVFPKVGGKMIVFLARTGSGFEIVNLCQGLWPLHEKTGAPMGMGHGISLPELEKAIVAAARK